MRGISLDIHEHRDNSLEKETSMSKDLLTINDFCEATNLGRTHVYRLLKNNEVKAIKVGRRTFIKREALEQWLENLEPYQTRSLTQGSIRHDK